MDEKTKHALKNNAAHLIMFARNGRWGSCADCPRDSLGAAYPELCAHTERYDHQLSMKELAENWEHSKKTATVRA